MADSELTNWKCGIDVIWGSGDGGDKGTAYQEEYFYYDKLMDDHKVVYLRGDTPINMSHNDRNVALNIIPGGQLHFTTIGQTGITGYWFLSGGQTGLVGTIRYKIDRDRQYYLMWADRTSYSRSGRLCPEYTGAFTLDSQVYVEIGSVGGTGLPVVGTTGNNGAPITDLTGCYYRGCIDPFGDEWHVLSYADDDNVMQRLNTGTTIQSDWYASDGKTVLLVVNPKTPALTVRVSGSGQFYTTPPKAYFTPKIVAQTTYISNGPTGHVGSVSFEIHDIYQNNIYYRINTGSWIDVGSNTVYLSQDDFVTGSNILEYYYSGNQAFTKTRTIVREPAYPSSGESHGNYLWPNSGDYQTVLQRIKRAPYSTYYTNYRTRAEDAWAGQDPWDLYANRGLRFNGGVGDLNGNSKSLINAFVALTTGYNYKIDASPKTFGQYAKEMLIESPRTIDSMSWEQLQTDDSLPSRELNYRGYYDSNPIQACAFAYDIMIGNFRADQIAGGITPIEDYFIRDHLANFVYDAMGWSMGQSILGRPMMWGGARMMSSTTVAIIMPDYSTEYYGTSGFGDNQTTYPLCPFENDQLTWKEALFDENTPKTAFPNYTWGVGFSNNGLGECVILAEGEVVGGHAYPIGTWRDKASYVNTSLMGRHLGVWANMAKLYANNTTNERLEVLFQRCLDGELIGATDDYPQSGRYDTTILILNSRWPHIANSEVPYIQSLPEENSDSANKQVQTANILAFAWYDDTMGQLVLKRLGRFPKLKGYALR